MVEPLNILLVWTVANNIRYIVSGRPVCSMLSELESLTPGVYEYMIENNMRFKFDVRFEYLDKEQSSNYPDRWCHVLYAIFENQGEAIAFYMWYLSQDF